MPSGLQIFACKYPRFSAPVASTMLRQQVKARKSGVGEGTAWVELPVCERKLRQRKVDIFRYSGAARSRPNQGPEPNR